VTLQLDTQFCTIIRQDHWKTFKGSVKPIPSLTQGLGLR